jgi:hypothetical protein
MKLKNLKLKNLTLKLKLLKFSISGGGKKKHCVEECLEGALLYKYSSENKIQTANDPVFFSIIILGLLCRIQGLFARIFQNFKSTLIYTKSVRTIIQVVIINL